MKHNSALKIQNSTKLSIREIEGIYVISYIFYLYK